ncbi:MAG: hypothetical protein H3C27_01295 [Opitutaceae bacterium]|nr:hypothetical protein [Opitutaceae bacterium]
MPASENRHFLVLSEGMSSAIYSLDIQPLARRLGRNIIQLVAYTSGLKLCEWKSGKIFSRKSTEDVRGYELVGTALSPEEFFNRTEQAERRVDANVGRQMIVALPRYDKPEQPGGGSPVSDRKLGVDGDEAETLRMMAILRQMAVFLSQLLGVPVFFAYHRPVSGRGKPDNPHGHFVFGPRPWDEATQTFAKTRFRALDAAKTGGPLIELIRLRWEEIINASLEPGMKPVSRLSHARKGNGLIAKRHQGYQVCAAEKIRPGNTRTAEFNRLVDRRAQLVSDLVQLECEEEQLNAEIQRLAAVDLAPMSAAASRSRAAESVQPGALSPISADNSRQQSIAALEGMSVPSVIDPVPQKNALSQAALSEVLQPDDVDPMAPMTASLSRRQAKSTVAGEVLEPLQSTNSKEMATKNAVAGLVHPVTADANRQQAKILAGKNLAGPEAADQKKALLPDQITTAVADSPAANVPVPDPPHDPEADIPADLKPQLSVDELRSILAHDRR